MGSTPTNETEARAGNCAEVLGVGPVDFSSSPSPLTRRDASGVNASRDPRPRLTGTRRAPAARPPHTPDRHALAGHRSHPTRQPGRARERRTARTAPRDWAAAAPDQSELQQRCQLRPQACLSRSGLRGDPRHCGAETLELGGCHRELGHRFLLFVGSRDATARGHGGRPGRESLWISPRYSKVVHSGGSRRRRAG